MKHAKHGNCENCGRPLALSPFWEIKHCPCCDASDITILERRSKVAVFIHEEIIVAGGGDLSYAELVQLGRHFRRRFRIAALQAAVLTPILWTGFFLFNNSVSVGFWEALNWREIIGFWEVSKWGEDCRLVGCCYISWPDPQEFLGNVPTWLNWSKPILMSAIGR